MRNAANSELGDRSSPAGLARRIAAAAAICLSVCIASACSGDVVSVSKSKQSDRSAPDNAAFGERVDERAALVRSLARNGIDDQPVLSAIARVPRHAFLPRSERADAYRDEPQPIGHGQTISQPYIVAYMSEQLDLRAGERVLEVGTGSGYQAAVLAELGAVVYSIEIIEPIAERARQVLQELGYGAIELRIGDGWAGWPEAAPFDAIIVTAAAPSLPQALLDQLAVGGRLVIPVDEQSDGVQWIWIYQKHGDGSVEGRRTLAVRFVPLTGGESR
jgi:protein-L-isoaspartate(D-aspartate) O-methyltransferase